MGQTSKVVKRKKVITKQVEAVVTVKTLLMKTKIVQPRISMTDVFNNIFSYSNRYARTVIRVSTLSYSHFVFSQSLWSSLAAAFAPFAA